MPQDFDQSGALGQNIKVYLGPTLGWVTTFIEPTLHTVLNPAQANAGTLFANTGLSAESLSNGVTGAGKIVLQVNPEIHSPTIIGTLTQSDGFAYLGAFNSTSLPITGIGAAFSWNFSGGGGEVDIWNTFPLASPDARAAFTFKQIDGLGSYRDLGSISALGGFVVGGDYSAASQLSLTETGLASNSAQQQVKIERTEATTPAESAQIGFSHHRTGGSGARVQVQAEIDTIVGGTNEYIVGWNGLAYAKKNGPAYTIAAFGGIFACKVDAALPAVDAVALEIDLNCLGDVVSKVGIQVVDESTSIGQGTGTPGSRDAGIMVGKQAGGRGFNYALQFGYSIAGAASEINNAFMYCPSGTIPYAVDFSGVTFSTAAWKGSFTASGSIGYAVGSGGVVTQLTNKSTAVTINKICGQIITNNATLNANTSVAFTVNNTQHAADDVVSLSIKGEATPGSYLLQVCAIASNSFAIQIRNITGGNLSEALNINFAIIKSVVS